MSSDKVIPIPTESYFQILPFPELMEASYIQTTEEPFLVVIKRKLIKKIPEDLFDKLSGLLMLTHVWTIVDP